MRPLALRAAIRAAVATTITVGIIQTAKTVLWWWQVLTTTPWGWL